MQSSTQYRSLIEPKSRSWFITLRTDILTRLLDDQIVLQAECRLFDVASFALIFPDTDTQACVGNQRTQLTASLPAITPSHLPLRSCIPTIPCSGLKTFWIELFFLSFPCLNSISTPASVLAPSLI